MWPTKAGTGLITGGHDGVVAEWSVQGTAVTKLKTYDLKMPEIMSMNPMAMSVCEHSSGAILVGTRGGEILEFDKNTGKPSLYLRSHFDSELWGLATHPTQSEIYTFGRDAMLAVWDLKTRRQKKHCKLDCPGDALAFSSDAKHLAIGFINGTFLVLDSNFKPVTKRGDRNGKAIQVLKYSPNNEILAVGAHDSMIFTYNAAANYKPMKKLRGHHSTITHLDFSMDGQFLMSNCTSYEILFFNLQTGK